MYQFKNPVILDLSSVRGFAEVHLAIGRALDFPDYYGCNLDALWDCLTDIAGEPLQLEIRGFENVEQRAPEAAKSLLKLLSDFRHYNGDRYLLLSQITVLRNGEREEIN